MIQGFTLFLAAKLLWRNWRSGEVKILVAALMLAVTVVTAIAVFSSRMDQSLARQSNTYLGADRVISGRFAIPTEWQSQLPIEVEGVEQTLVTEFSSMVFASKNDVDEMQLASIKAVGDRYPLRGQLEVSDIAFALGEDITIAPSVPQQGEVWVDSRLLPLMNLALGDSLAVGNKDFIITKVVIREPDTTTGFSALGPRVLMNQADLEATGVIQIGSRVTYRWLLAGEESALRDFEAWITPQLGEHYIFRTLKNSQRNISSALDRGTRFLMLAAVMGVLLASVAIAIAAQHFSRRQTDQVALLKSLGASAPLVRQLYLLQMLLLGILASTLGVAIGEVVQRAIASSIGSLFSIELVTAAWTAYATGWYTGILCLLCFALPPLWHLPKVPPLKILRRELTVAAVSVWMKAVLGIGAIIALIGWYSGDILITLSIVAGFAVVILLGVFLALFMLRYSHKAGSKAGSYWRLALSNIERYRAESITQIIVFACALMLLMVLYAIRTSLIEEWRLQLPVDAPNHFIMNIAPYEKAQLETLLAANTLNANPMFPMVLGRISALNNVVYNEDTRQRSNSLRRELNLSWADTIAPSNQLVAGEWWDRWQGKTGLPGVSVELEEAKEIGLALGDVITFSLGGIALQAEVASFRSVDWNAMRPNFFFLFSPGTLDNYSANFLTSVFIPPAQKTFVNTLLKQHPTIVVIEVDRIIERIRSIVEQVGKGIELVLWLVLLGGVMVLIAAVNASMTNRLQETGLLRALGSGRRLIVSSLTVEFALLGFLAGVIGVLGAEALLIGLQWKVFEGHISPHYLLWFAGPILGALFIGSLGVLSCRRVISVPPSIVLREVG
jgi:putative ABC transport system permease protein